MPTGCIQLGSTTAHAECSANIRANRVRHERSTWPLGLRRRELRAPDARPSQSSPLVDVDRMCDHLYASLLQVDRAILQPQLDRRRRLV